MKTIAFSFIGLLLLYFVFPFSSVANPDDQEGNDDSLVSVSDRMSAKRHGNQLHGFVPQYDVNDNPVTRIFAVSVQPLGFVQFGPVAGIDFGISQQVAFHSHVRFTSLGLLSKLARKDDDLDFNQDEPGNADKFRGMAFGFGPLFYFGENRSRFYMGPVFEIATAQVVYNFNTFNYYPNTPSPYSVTVDEMSLIWSNNIGYRSVYPSGLFINTGIYLGLNFRRWTEDHSLNHNYDDSDEGVYPYVMLELALGYTF